MTGDAKPPPMSLRCKRNDGKKWRCSQLKMEDDDFCEKHRKTLKRKSTASVDAPRVTKDRCRRNDGKKWRCYQLKLEDDDYCEKHSSKRKRNSIASVDAPRVTKDRGFGKRASSRKETVSSSSSEEEISVKTGVVRSRTAIGGKLGFHEEGDDLVDGKRPKLVRRGGSATMEKEPDVSEDSGGENDDVSEDSDGGRDFDSKLAFFLKRKSLKLKGKGIAEVNEEEVSEKNDRLRRSKSKCRKVQEKTPFSTTKTTKKVDDRADGKEKLTDRRAKAPAKCLNAESLSHVKKSEGQKSQGENTVEMRRAESDEHDNDDSERKRKFGGTMEGTDKKTGRKYMSDDPNDPYQMCHQCMKSDRKVVRCGKCPRRRYCFPCVATWYTCFISISVLMKFYIA